MSKPYPALCRECKWSKKEDPQRYDLRCFNPIINANDSYALSSTELGAGTCCRDERRKVGWLFVKCGMKGKLWEPKDKDKDGEVK